jgi:hypothetical protein
MLINFISNIHDIGISILQHPQNQEKPARVSFFICQKIPSNCFSGKADAIPFLIMYLKLEALSFFQIYGINFSTKAIRNIPVSK